MRSSPEKVSAVTECYRVKPRKGIRSAEMFFFLPKWIYKTTRLLKMTKNLDNINKMMVSRHQ